MGGSAPQPPQVIPAPPPPDVQDTARNVAQARLEFDPQLQRQQAALTRELAPGLAQVGTDIQRQQAPQLQEITESLFPQLPVLQQQTLQRLQSPIGLTPEQQASQEAIRQRSREQVQRNVRTGSNVGGTLFGGNRELREDRALGELEQGFNLQDIALQQQERDRTLSELRTLFQMLFPGVQQTPGIPQAGVGLSADNLFNALVSNQGNFGVIQGQPGTPGIGNSIAQGAASALPFLPFMCHVAVVLYGAEDIRTHLARAYAMTHANWFTRLYRGFSDVWAGWLTRLPILKRFARPIWDRMWRQQLHELLRRS